MLSPSTPPGKALKQAIMKGKPRIRRMPSRVIGTREHNDDKPTFLLIPGFGCNSQVMSQIGSELIEMYNIYYSRIYRVDWPKKDLKQISEDLAGEIRGLIEAYNLGNDLQIIGHSTGGLTPLIALAMHTDLRVSRIIQLATPNTDGTPLGKLPIVRRVRSIKGIQRGVTHIELQNFGHIDSIIAGSDLYVPPENQSNDRLDLPDGVHRTNHTIPGASHMDLIQDTGTIQLILQQLRL